MLLYDIIWLSKQGARIHRNQIYMPQMKLLTHIASREAARRGEHVFKAGVQLKQSCYAYRPLDANSAEINRPRRRLDLQMKASHVQLKRRSVPSQSVIGKVTFTWSVA